MATRKQSSKDLMRKRPLQQRATTTVEAIVEAAAHILATQGWNGFNTNVIAEIAGVSIGSLYQYFPNKRALVELIRERHFNEVLEILTSASDLKRTRSQRLDALVQGMIAIHSRFPGLYRVLRELAPDEGGRLTHATFDKAWVQGYEQVVLVNAECGTRQVRLKAIVLAGALAGAVHEAAHRNLLRTTELVSELNLLVANLLNLRVECTRSPGSRK